LKGEGPLGDMLEKRADNIERSLKQFCLLARKFVCNGGTREEEEEEEML
jgi:hypothetical protein